MNARRRRWLLAAVGGLIGFAISGPIVGLAGVILGAVSIRRPYVPMTTAVALLIATAILMITEAPVGLASFGAFLDSRTISNQLARLAAGAWVLGTVSGCVVNRGARPRRESMTAPTSSGGSDLEDLLRVGHLENRPPALSLAAAGTVAAALSLIVVGDGSFVPLALVLGLVGIASGIAGSRSRVHALISQASAVGRSSLAQLRPSRLDPRGGPDDVGRGTEGVVLGSAWMLGSTAAVSIGSFVFWIVAARVTTQESVGQAAALFSVVTFLNYATSLGLPVVMTRFGRRDASSSTLFTISLCLTSLSSIVGVMCFLLIAPSTVDEALGRGFGMGTLALCANTIGMSLSVLVDARCLTLRLWSWVFWRTVAIAIIRLPLVLLVVGDGGDSTLLLFNIAAGGYTLTGLAVFELLLIRGRERLRIRPNVTSPGDVARFAAVNYLGQLAIQGPLFGVPLIALSVLDAQANASFYLAWGIMSVVVISIQVVGQVLLVEGDAGDRADQQARVALTVGLLVSIAATAAVALLNPLIRIVYGPGYEQVPGLLVVLVLGTIPYAVTVVGLNRARIDSDHRRTLVTALGFSVLVLLPTVVFAQRFESVGLAWAWCGGNIAAAVVVTISWAGRRDRTRDRSGAARNAGEGGANTVPAHAELPAVAVPIEPDDE